MPAGFNDNISMALFCDFENIALGVRDASFDRFDIELVLERLLLKGSIVVKKAYCDWERYKAFKAGMHEANFELIEIPHVRQSGKNSADIRLVVDALDLCYTKAHVDTFVIISGDSDFSPLVSKLRENAKQVIGVGVKQSTSDLLITNCDEFIFYDDLVREQRRGQREVQQKNSADLERRRKQAIALALETFEALVAERDDSGKVWASMLKQAIKRRRPDFNESYFGFKAFGNLLEEAQRCGLLELGRDEKSGTFIVRPDATDNAVPASASAPEPAGEPILAAPMPAPAAATEHKPEMQTSAATDHTVTPAAEVAAAQAATESASPAKPAKGSSRAAPRKSTPKTETKPKPASAAKAAPKARTTKKDAVKETTVKEPGKEAGSRATEAEPQATAAMPTAEAPVADAEATAKPARRSRKKKSDPPEEAPPDLITS